MTLLVPPIEIHRFVGNKQGPHLLVLGAVHGIEVCGPIAIQRIIKSLERQEFKIESGQVTFIPICNPEAYAIRKRYAGRDLNRALGPISHPQSGADFFANTICDIMEDCDVLLDLHSFRADGDAFIFVGPVNNSNDVEPFGFADEELSFARSLGVKRMVYGWFSSYDRYVKNQKKMIERLDHEKQQQIRRAESDFGKGTTEYFRSLGGKYGVTLECGNHLDESSIKVALLAIKRAMEHLGITATEEAEEERHFSESFLFTEIFLREDAGDTLARKYTSFDSVRKGDPLGYRASGEAVLAPADGAVIFSYDDAKIGNEWIYFAENSTRGMGPEITNNVD